MDFCYFGRIDCHLIQILLLRLATIAFKLYCQIFGWELDEEFFHICVPRFDGYGDVLDALSAEKPEAGVSPRVHSSLFGHGQRMIVARDNLSKLNHVFFFNLCLLVISHLDQLVWMNLRVGRPENCVFFPHIETQLTILVLSKRVQISIF